MSGFMLLAVATTGALGALTRYAIDTVITSRLHGVRPWGTWTVNITGSFALGLAIPFSLAWGWPEWLTISVCAGFLGAYTTFSTWMYETLRLMEEGVWGLAAINAVGSVFTGVAAAACGVIVGGGSLG